MASAVVCAACAAAEVDGDFALATVIFRVINVLGKEAHASHPGILVACIDGEARGTERLFVLVDEVEADNGLHIAEVGDIALMLVNDFYRAAVDARHLDHSLAIVEVGGYIG